jgi:hypothetical protein
VTLIFEFVLLLTRRVRDLVEMRLGGGWLRSGGIWSLEPLEVLWRSASDCCGERVKYEKSRRKNILNK